MAPRAAIVGSWDTKREEMRFMFSRLAASHLDPFYIDVSTLDTDPLDSGTGYSSDEIRRPHIVEWNALTNSGRGEKIDFMAAAAAEFVCRLHREGQINGIISAGGLQNTVLATSAMRRLPIGLPKVMVTTAATGLREFQLVTGNRDIIVVPSLSDLAGVNMFTRTTLDNACACLAGMLTLAENPGEGIRRGSRLPVGLTQMGVTNIAAVAAIRRLRELGFEPVGFHATGSGGPTMEECVGEGQLHGALDMTLHEIVSDVMKTGYSVGAKDRLERLLAGDAPVLLAPGGLDFIDDWTDNFPGGLEGRRFVLHNSNLAHIKLTTEEATRVGRVIGNRIAGSRRSVDMLIPTGALRSEAEIGGEMHDPEVDKALVDAIIGNAGPGLRATFFEGDLNTEAFGVAAAELFSQISRRTTRGGE